MSSSFDNINVYRSQLKATLLQLGSAPDAEIDQFVNLFEEVRIPKKSSIIRPGDETDRVHFVVRGIVRIYYEKENKEITNWFISEGRFFAPVYHLFTGKANPNYYEALEETITISASYREMEKLYARHHSLEHIGRKLVELYYADFLRQSYNVLSLSADERYLNFLKNSPELMSRVPLRFIASYLGLTQETLSRLRARH